MQHFFSKRKLALPLKRENFLLHKKLLHHDKNNRFRKSSELKSI
jgi:hypothetical protein